MKVHFFVPVGVRGCAVLVAALAAAPVAAFDFNLGDADDIEGAWNTTLWLGAAWRTRARDSELYSPDNGNQQGLPTGRGGNADDGNLNYGKGDNFLRDAMFISDLSLKKNGFGGLVRVKGWYDDAPRRDGVPHGNEANDFRPGAALSDRGFEPLSKFGGAYLLDMYAFGNWKLGENNLYGSVGRQIINWGKGLFLQGLDQIDPIDVNSLRRPGTPVKDALLPVNMPYGKLDLASGPTIEAFYQFTWQPSVIEGCGTYFSSIDAQIGPNTASSGCPAAVIAGADSVGYAARNFVPLATSQTPRNGGQFGLAARQFVPAIATEVGVYAMNIHSRTVVLDGIRGEVPF